MKKKAVKFFLSTFIFLFPFVALAAYPTNDDGVNCLLVSGAGTSAYNDYYSPTGTHGGVEYYQSAGGLLIYAINSGAGYWGMWTSFEEANPIAYAKSGNTAPSSGSWGVDAFGSSPAPTVSVFGATCPTPPPPVGHVWSFGDIFGAATSSASSTIAIVDNPTQDVFNGFIMFCVGMTLMMWLFKKR